MRSLRSIRLGAALVILAGILSACSRSDDEKHALSSDAPVLTANAVRGPLTVTVSAYGQIESQESHRIIPEIKSQAEVSFLVEEGSRVQKDEVVARLTSEELTRRLEALETQIEERKSAVESRQTELEIQIIDNTTQLKKTKLNLRKFEQELEQFLQGDRPLKRRNAEIRLKNTEGDLKRGAKRYEDLKGLLEEGFITEDEVEEARLNIEVHEINVGTAKLEQDILEKYDLPLDLAAAENSVETAETDLEKTLKLNMANKRAKDRALAVARQQLERTEREFKEANEELAGFEVRAPAEGVVSYGDPSRPWRGTDIQVGMTLRRGQVLMRIPVLKDLKAVVNVQEGSIRKVKLEDVCVVAVDALPDRTFEAHVVRVAEVPIASHWLASDVKEFSVELSLVEHDGLKPGFSCHADIITATLPDVLTVPVQAVFRDGDEYYVYAVKGSAHERRTVRLGLSSETAVVIVEGLEAGDKGYLSDPNPRGDEP
ncbi:MAG: efflux RND transporter periplasmic adaptor subunit [Verrucomicrobia bacterium]|nr:efflux RND transporter periplasmic adaptor subunit [Verrucomicrobiota bacterium]